MKVYKKEQLIPTGHTGYYVDPETCNIISFRQHPDGKVMTWSEFNGQFTAKLVYGYRSQTTITKKQAQRLINQKMNTIKLPQKEYVAFVREPSGYTPLKNEQGETLVYQSEEAAKNACVTHAMKTNREVIYFERAGSCAPKINIEWN